METFTTIAIIKLGIKILIFIGGVLAIIHFEGLLNKKSFKRGGKGHESESNPEGTIH
jgi:hypothetical protein